GIRRRRDGPRSRGRDADRPHHPSTVLGGGFAWASCWREGSLFGIIAASGNKGERRAGEAITTRKRPREVFAHYDQSVISMPFSNAPVRGSSHPNSGTWRLDPGENWSTAISTCGCWQIRAMPSRLVK